LCETRSEEPQRKTLQLAGRRLALTDFAAASFFLFWFLFYFFFCRRLCTNLGQAAKHCGAARNPSGYLTVTGRGQRPLQLPPSSAAAALGFPRLFPPMKCPFPLTVLARF